MEHTPPQHTVIIHQNQFPGGSHVAGHPR
jgi:hypothetical protein